MPWELMIIRLSIKYFIYGKDTLWTKAQKYTHTR